jgi:hypothetical protein
LGDFRIILAFEEAEGEDFGCPGTEPGDGLSQPVADFIGPIHAVGSQRSVFGKQGGHVFQGDMRRCLPGADQVQRCVYGCSPQITFYVADGFGVRMAAQQAHEDGLQDVFSVAGVARDAVSRTEHGGVVLPENKIQIWRSCLDRRFQLRGGLHDFLPLLLFIHETAPGADV